MTEDTAHPEPEAEEEHPLAGMGNAAFFIIGLLIGAVAASAIGLVVLMALDPLGPSGRSDVAVLVTTIPDDGGEAGSVDPVAGEEIYASTCVACHGPNAEGITGLGPALVDNEFIQSQTDAELVEFLKVGRPVDHPDNTTGVAMPPKGGNPSLSDEDLADVAAYLRTLQ